jgi:hypothetical protein
MNTVDYRKERAQLTSALKRIIRKHLSKSGYREGPVGNSHPLKVWVPRDKSGRPTLQSFRLRGGYVLQDFEGFCDGGVIVDGCGVAIVTRGFEDFPLEDLFRLKAWVERKFAPATKPRKLK